MTAAFSGNLLDSYHLAQSPRGPFGQASPQVVTSAALAYAPTMHGNFSNFSQMSSAETARKIATMQAKLNKKLGPEYISQRPGPGGGPKLTYAEGWKIINLANEVFGFNGWSSNVVSLTTDFIDYLEETKRYNVGVTAIVRVTLRDGVFHEDIGYGMLENAKSKAAALDKCKKEAVTDAIKRSLRNFGNLLGNCLYDKSYTQEIVKIKVPPPKFNKDELHRRPEFTETPQAGPHISGPSSIKSEQQQPAAESSRTGQASAVPPHMRSNAMTTPNKPPPQATSSSSAGPSRFNTGLSTPITPANLPGAGLHPVAGLSNRSNNTISRPNAVPTVPKPQPPQPQALPQPASDEKHVTFAASQDEYDLAPEDDAFLATVDLGEGDAGIGGHIDFDEGSGGIAVGEDDSFEGTRHVSNRGVAQTDCPRESSRGPDRKPTTKQPQQQQQQPPQQQQRPPNSNQAQPQKPAKSRAELLEEYERQEKEKRRQTAEQERRHQEQQQKSSSADAPVKSLSPSPAMGGFRFPGAGSSNNSNPNSSSNNKPAPPLQQTSRVAPSSGAGSGIGVKRTADMMQGQPVQRRPVQGMGLAQQGAGAPVRREPLGTIELGEGGDVKRLRR
ncbi:unnamed protein product [Somion occarium]|uniref:Uncharacterized protein n=1 Tax=Somion occarium TaxID=3059160 RepID=A0ABP1CUI4_9APHY